MLDELVQDPETFVSAVFDRQGRVLAGGADRQMACLASLLPAGHHPLQGVHLPGSETSVDASLKVIGDWRLAGRAYRSLQETHGSTYRSQGEGASLGMGYFRQGWRLDVRGSQREWSYGEQPTTARTVAVSFGVPLGPLSLGGFADVGEQRRDTLRQPTQSLRADLRWSGRAGTVSWNGSYYETLTGPPRLRTDLLGSMKLGEWELAGGAWTTRGWARGGEPGFWTQVGMPVRDDLLLTVGFERARPPLDSRPPASARSASGRSSPSPCPSCAMPASPGTGRRERGVLPPRAMTKTPCRQRHGVPFFLPPPSRRR